MKTAIIALAFFATPVAFGTGTNTTTMDYETSDSMESSHFSTNSNDRFDNLDTRTNSLSTPARVGGSSSRLEADITEEPTADSPMMSGSSTAEDSSWEDSEESFQSGSATEEAPLDQSPDATRDSATEADRDMMNETAAGAGAGAVTSEVTKAKKDTKKKFKKAKKRATSSTDDEMSRTESDRLSGSSTTGSGLTAQDTMRTQNETELVRKIRSQITDTDNLSMRAHNIKIISQNGQIYLKGPVANATEKSKIEELAKKTAGNTAVINETYVENR